MPLHETRAAAVPADGELLAAWAREAQRGEALVIAGFCELAPDGRLFNSSALIDGSESWPCTASCTSGARSRTGFEARGNLRARSPETRYGAIGPGRLLRHRVPRADPEELALDPEQSWCLAQRGSLNA